MSINELREWSVYLSKEPVNSNEIQLALLTTVVANMMGGKREIDDFLITTYKPPKEQTYLSEDEVARAFMAFASQD